MRVDSSTFSGLLRRLAVGSVICGICCLGSMTQAADLTLGLDLSAEATVGLDEPTRTLIANLPADLRKQVIEGLKEALPLIDDRVTDYLSKVNDVIDSQINHASCAALGATQGITHLFGATLTGTSPTPIADLDSVWRKTRSRYGLRSSPHDIVIGYGDFLALAAITSCEVASAAEARETVALEQTNARWRWNVWKRVVDQCTSAKECTDAVSHEVHTALSSAAPEDLREAAAARRIKALDDGPLGDPGWWAQVVDATGVTHVPLGIYEDRMSQLFRIEDDVHVARLKRGTTVLKASQVSVAEQQKTYDDFKPTLQKFHAGCNASEAAKNDAIVASMDKLALASADVKKGFASAVQIEPRLETIAETKIQTYAQLLTQASELRQMAAAERKAMTGHITGDDDCKAHWDNPHNIHLPGGIDTGIHNPF